MRKGKEFAMHFSVDRGPWQWVFRPLNDEAHRWLRDNYSSTADLVRPAEHGQMIVRALRADNLEVTFEPQPQLDFDDQYATFLVAKAKREAGNCQEALGMLVRLRGDVLAASPVAPKSAGLLPLIDAEIAAAHAACRVDRIAVRRGPANAAASRWLGGWLHWTTSLIEGAMLRVVLSILLMVEIYRFMIAIV
jgi:hypothetical protein